MVELHFLRPFWFFALVPLLILTWIMLSRPNKHHAWQAVCDPHLLPLLIKTNKSSKKAPILLSLSTLFMIISLSGPSWNRLPVPSFQHIQPRVVVLDLSKDMLKSPPSPNRLTRAKFKLHDLVQHKESGQFGLIVYTFEPFIVSPLTDDGKTIDALLPSLSPDIMPISGNRLDKALLLGQQLITQAGFHAGDILVLSATAPSKKAIHVANVLAKKGIHTSVLPISLNDHQTSSFDQLALAGRGEKLSFVNTDSDILQWLNHTKRPQRELTQSKQHIPVWQDEGRWFIIPAIMLLLPVFRRGWMPPKVSS